jgi:hypothetical protein
MCASEFDNRGGRFQHGMKTPCAILLVCIFTVWATSLGDSPALRIQNALTVFGATMIRLPPWDNRGFAIIDAPAATQGDNILSHWNEKKIQFMINGGYFNPDFSPTGYCKINGRTITAAKSPSLSGFIAIDEKGALSILTSAENPMRFDTVLQNGPFVIDPGGRMGIRSRTGKTARRTLVGQTYDNEIIILVTFPFDLYDLARAVKRHLPETERLLNLDGGPSTAIKSRLFEIVNSSPVRNYLAKRKENTDAFQVED